MVLGVVDKAETLVLDNHEKLDSWAVVLNGCVECTLPDSNVKLYNVGDQLVSIVFIFFLVLNLIFIK